MYLIRKQARTEQGKWWLGNFTIESLHYKLIFTTLTLKRPLFLIVR